MNGTIAWILSKKYTDSKISTVIPIAEKGVANGVAELNDSGKIPAEQLPSYIDDVLEFDSISDFPVSGERGKIYVALDTNKTYRWGGTEYVAISDVTIATTLVAGIVKPSADFDVATDGTLSLYKQIAISSVTARPNVVEIGTIVDDVLVSWAVNKQPVSQTVNGEAVDASIRSKEFTNLGLTSRRVFTVSVADARTIKTGSATVEFYNSVFYGVAEEWNRSVMTGNVRASNLSSFSVNAGADDYIWYAIPATYQTPRFFVGGFEGGFSLHATQNVTNASGYTESYKIFRSDNKALGQTTVTLE